MSDHPPELKKLLKDLCPLVDLIREMLGSARHAFNRHSKAELDKIARLQREFTLTIDPFFLRVEDSLKSAPEARRPEFLQMQQILTHLERLADRVASLAEPILQKGNRGAILSDQDFFQVNDVFTRLTGLLRTLVDLMKTADPTLKAYILRECDRLAEECRGERAAHESRMMDSAGQPAAWGVYVALMERFRDSLNHLRALAESLP